MFPTIRAPPQPFFWAAQASRACHCCNCFKSKENDPPTLLPNWVSKMSACFGFAALHSVNPPTANGFPVATLISMFPDSDHFHSWLSAPVKDHISSLGSFVDMKFFLVAFGWQGEKSFFLNTYSLQLGPLCQSSQKAETCQEYSRGNLI